MQDRWQIHNYFKLHDTVLSRWGLGVYIEQQMCLRILNLSISSINETPAVYTVDDALVF